MAFLFRLFAFGEEGFDFGGHDRFALAGTIMAAAFSVGRRTRVDLLPDIAER